MHIGVPAISVVAVLFLATIGAANASLPVCPVKLQDPAIAMTGTEVQVIFEFNSSPPGIYDWGASPDCKGGVCSVNVKVSHPAPTKCLVYWVMHTDRHTYTLLPKTLELDIYADNGQSWQIKLQNLPPITDPDTPNAPNAPVGGQVQQVNAFRLVAPWLVLSGIFALAIVVIALRSRGKPT